MYSNFEFLREVDRDLYELGKSIEQQAVTAPSAVLAEGTTFLDNIVISISENDNVPIDEKEAFWKNCEKLYQANAISEGFKKLLIKTFDIRNHMHGRIKSTENYLNGNKNRAITMVHLLFSCAWDFYKYLGNKHAKKPEYMEIEVLDKKVIDVENCIVCGNKTDFNSFFCSECNEVKKTSRVVEHFCEEFGYEKLFSELNIGPLGYDKETLEKLLPKLVDEGFLYDVNNKFLINKQKLHELRSKISEFNEIENLFKQCYFDELTMAELKQKVDGLGDELSEGLLNNFQEFLKNESRKLFLKECKTDKSIKEINRANLVDPKDISVLVFSNCHEVISKLKKEYINYKKAGVDIETIKSDLLITTNVCSFLERETKEELAEIYAKEQFYNDLMDGKSLNDALADNDLKIKKINELRKSDSEFENKIQKVIDKRKNILFRSLKTNGYEKALKEANLEENYLNIIFSNEDLIKIDNILKNRYYEIIKDFKTSTEAMELLEVGEGRVNSWFDDEFKNQICDVKSYNLLQLLLKGTSLDNALAKTEISRNDFEENLLVKEEFNKIIRNGESILSNTQLKFSFRNLIGLNKTPDEIKSILSLSDDNYILLESILCDDLIEIKKNRYLSSLRCGSTYSDALTTNKLTEEEISEFKSSDISFKQQCIEIRENRKAILLFSLEENGFKTAFNESKLTQKQLDTLFNLKSSDTFYTEVNQILREKFLKFIEEGIKLNEALELCEVGDDWFENWMRIPEFKEKMEKNNFQVLINLLNSQTPLDDALKHCNISRKEFDNYVLEAFNGNEEYGEVLDIYFDNVYDEQFGQFLDDLSNNDTKTALKNVGLSEEIFFQDLELNEAHRETYLEARKQKYIRTCIKNGHGAALKFSELSEKEFKDNEYRLLEIISAMKKDYLIAEIENHNKNPFQALKKIDLDIEEVYATYQSGIYGGKDSKFAIEFERVFIKPMAEKVIRLMDDKKISVNRALNELKNESESLNLNEMAANDLDIRKFNRTKALLRSRSIKQKDLSSRNVELSLSNEDFKLWKKYKIFENFNYRNFDINTINLPDMASC